MQLPKWILGTLVIAASLQPLLGQALTAQASPVDSSKTDKFDVARASGFDFNQVSDLTRVQNNSAVPKLGNSHRPNSTVILDPDQARALANESLCLSLRVYTFSREDGEAPQLTGYTTCTPAGRAARKDIEGANEPAQKRKYIPRLYKPL